MKRWLRSLQVQLVSWAVMPVAFVLIAISFTGVYAHQKSMRDFVVERNGAMVRMAARIAADGLARGVVGVDGTGLDVWMDLANSDLPGEVMVIDRTARVLSYRLAQRIGEDVNNLAGIREAVAQRDGYVITSSEAGAMLVAFAPVEGSEWIVVIREPINDLIGPMLRFPSLVPAVAASAGILSLAILLVGWRTIIHPLQQLAQSAEQVSWGDYAAIARPIQGVQQVRDLHQTLKEMVERIRGYEASVRDYLSAVTQGQEAERARLARELHDGPVQTLIALGQRAEMAQRLLERGQEDRATAVLAELRHAEQDAVRELRRMIGALRPIYLEDLGFVPALEMLVSQSVECGGAQIRLEQAQTVYRLSPEVELAAYRIVQEALNNALQHAQAKQITIRVQCEMPMLVLTVVDDGIGFEFPNQPYLLTHEGHFGLLGMQERATRLGGTFHVHTAPGQGTCVTVRLPNPSLT